MSWTIDPNHTKASFTVAHMMISKVNGEMGPVTGTVEFDPENPENTSAEINIDITTISTGQTDRDNHLRSADFFNVEEYPAMTFKSTGVEVIDENTARLTGDLTIRDVTRPVTLDVEFNGLARDPFQGYEAAGFSANCKLDRTEWNLTWNQALETGGVLVGTDVAVNIELELMREAETANT
ncbi:MAG: YceI family protein [Chloroflexi bacterium]|nr:YceI family protein [Chloroflexota bacterium]